ncbi:MAG: transcriptional regulator, LysR family [Myxococcaceae bacterium]|nr:transcriptional regulator, LysR family [Myxococcaceae bacterium]
MALINADLRDIRYFAAVVEHGSLTRAALQLKVSQPTLTHAVARLEEALGGSVWRRSKNRRLGVVPTELGQRVLERGGRALAELDALGQDAAHLRGLTAGGLRVGSVQSLAGTLLPRWVAHYLAKYPAITLDLPLVTSETADGLIKSGKLDAALVVGPPPTDPALKRTRCGEQELLAVVPAGHALAKRKRIAVDALAQEPFVLVPAGTFFAIAIEDVCRRAGFSPLVRARIASISGLCALVRAGVAVTILPEGSIPAGDGELAQVRFEKPQPRRAVHLIWRADVAPSPALRAFIDVAKDVVSAS